MSKTQRTVPQVDNPLTTSKLTAVCASVNKTMLRLQERLNEFEIPDFGSSLYSDNGDSCLFLDNNTIIASLVTDRIVNKFERPSRHTESLLKRQCNTDWIAYERDHLKRVNLDSLPHECGRGAIWGASKLIDEWMSGVRFGKRYYKYSFWYFLDNAPIEFGPGESFNSLRGEAHLFGKLNPHNATVTADALQLASFVVASNKALRVVFASAIRKSKDADLIASTEHHSAYLEEKMKKSKIGLHIRVFANRVRKFLTAKNLVQQGSRGSSVYKNSQKRRFINVECLLNVVIQKMISYALRRCLKQNAKIDLDTGQELHKVRIQSSLLTTVDFSNASDSILRSLLHKLFHRDKRLMKLLETVRSPFVLIDTPCGDRSTKRVYHESLKFSSMGNGYTFELLTIVTCAVARTFDRGATSYGDDVIISNEVADAYIQTMENLGFKVNKKKTFNSLPFRESCGAFFLEGYGYIRSFDFKWNHNIADCVVTGNKLRRILQGNPRWKHPVKDALDDALNEIDDLIPRALRGPAVDSDDIPIWYESANYLRGHRKDPYVKKQWGRYGALTTVLNDAYKCPLGSYESRFWTVVMLPELKQKVSIRAASDVKSMRLAYAYIYSGRVSSMLIRQQKEEYTFVFKPTLVHTSGLALRAATARRIVTAHKSLLLKRFKEVILQRIALAKLEEVSNGVM